MKNKKPELDVDFIGIQGQSLTKEEELAISNYIRDHKAKHKTKHAPPKQTKKLQMHINS